MSAVIEGKTQEEMFLQLLGILMGRFEEKDLDYFKVGYCSKKVPEDWEMVEIVFKPKKGKIYKKCNRCKARKVITEEYYTQCLDCGQIYRRLPIQERKEGIYAKK